MIVPKDHTIMCDKCDLSVDADHPDGMMNVQIRKYSSTGTHSIGVHLCIPCFCATMPVIKNLIDNRMQGGV